MVNPHMTGRAQSASAQRSARTRRVAIASLVVVMMAFALTACVNDLTPRGRWSQPVVHENYIYVGNADGAVVRLDTTTHQWDANWMYPFELDDGIKKPMGGRAMYGAPTVHDGIIYANNYTCTGNVCEGKAFSVSVATGNSAWPTADYDIRTKLIGRQVITSDGYAVFGSTAIDRERNPPGYLYALEAGPDTLGRFAFRVTLDGEVQGDVAYDEGRDRVFLGTDAGTVYAIDVSRNDAFANANDSRVLWKYSAQGAITGPVSYINGAVYFGDLSGRAYKINQSTQTEEWVHNAQAWIWTHPVVDAEVGRAYVSTLGGHVLALDDRTGQVIWEQQIEGQIVGQPLLYTRTFVGIDQQVLAVPSGDEGVHLLNTADGSNLGTIPTGTGVKSSPALINDKLYVHNLDDELRWFNASDQGYLGCVKLGDGGRCG